MGWSVVIDWLLTHGIRAIAIVILGVVFYFLSKRLLPSFMKITIARSAKDRPEIETQKRTTTLIGVFGTTMKFMILAIAFFMLLSEFNIDIAPVLAGVGIVGIAIGFGAQSLVKDIISGILVLVENHYGVGDVVKLADISGLVEDVNLRRTVLRDLDGIVHIIPNGEIRIASNFTREWSRVNMNVSVGYGEDIDRVIGVINRVGKELSEDPVWKPKIIKAPQVLRVDNLGDSGIEIKILGDTKPIMQWEVMGELRRRIKNTFDREGIEIPWPHTKVYFGNSPVDIKHDIKS